MTTLQIEELCRVIGYRYEVLRGRSRLHEFVYARAALMHWMKRYTRLNTTHIGLLFNRDHATVLHNLKTVQNAKDTKHPYQLIEMVNALEKYHEDTVEDSVFLPFVYLN